MSDTSFVPVAQGDLRRMRELSEHLTRASIDSEIVCPPAKGGG